VNTSGSSLITPPPLAGEQRFEEILNRLVGMSQRDYYDPYRLFTWPDKLDDDGYWMSPELMIEHGTEVGAELTDEQVRALSKWESINFYSLNVHGIRELIIEIVGRIHTTDFAIPSEYFHHIIGEENEHMWFFATFCHKYGGKIYQRRSLGFTDPGIPAADNFLVFSRLLIFEELVDFFNQQMGQDERLHPTIRQVNGVHHQDESRHIAFGRQIIDILHRDLRKRLPASDISALEVYLKRYLRASVDSLCDPAMYRDAGLSEPYALRRRVLADPAYHEYTQRILRRITSFMVHAEILSDDRIPTP
jgi:hypothetical protein